MNRSINIKDIALIASILIILSIISITLNAKTVFATAPIDSIDRYTFHVPRNTSISADITIRNVGDSNLTGLHVILSGASPSYDMQAALDGNAPLNILEPAEQDTIHLTGFIPSSIPGENVTLGNLQIITDQSTKEIPISADINSKLTLDNVEITIGRYVEDKTNDGDTLEDYVVPGYNIGFGLKVTNQFDNPTAYDINDVDITITLVGISDGEDMEYDSGEFSIAAGKHEWDYSNMTIPLDASEGDYAIDIVGDGWDETGIRQGFTRRLYLKVKRLGHDLRVTSADFDRNNVKCGDVANLQASIINVGNNDEDNAFLVVKNDALGIKYTQQFTVTDLIGENTYDARIPIYIPQNATNGAYTIMTQLFDSNNGLNYIANTPLIISGCNPVPASSTTTIRSTTTTTLRRQANISQSGNTTQNPQNNNNRSNQSNGQMQNNNSGNANVQDHGSYFDRYGNNGFITIMIIALVVILVGIIAAIAYLLKK